eukprot:30530-Pelagococcus_subviridis.AAC.2
MPADDVHRDVLAHAKVPAVNPELGQRLELLHLAVSQAQRPVHRRQYALHEDERRQVAVRADRRVRGELRELRPERFAVEVVPAAFALGF